MRKRFIYILIGLGVGTFAIAFAWLGLFSGVEHRIQDRLFAERPIDNRIVIIAIDDASLADLGQWPLPRATYARLFEKLEDAGPLAVGFDVMLAESSRLGTGDDRLLARTLENITYPLIFPLEGRATAPPVIPLSKFTVTQNVQLGHVNLTIDPDSVVRSLPAKIRTDEAVYNSFAESVVSHAGIRYRPFEDTQQRIVYASAPGSISRIPLHEALTEPDETFADKLVFIGATAPDLHDEQAVPVSHGILMPGIEIQAMVTNQLIHEWRLTDAPWWCILLWLFSAAFIPSLLFIGTQRLRIIISGSFILFLTHIIIALIVFDNGTAAPFLHISLAALASPIALFGWRYTIGELEKRQLKHAFSKYVSPQVMDEILAHPSMVSLGGEKREVTVLFSDIRSFTALSEQTTPEELVDILNEYFTEMTEAILEEGGVLDKYIGDAIMAFWGAPLTDPNQTDKAVRASRKMLNRLAALNAQLRRDKKPEIQIGIGLYTGPAIAGNIGSEKRFDYTVIGDTVNVASRLEGLTKEYQTALIIGESTKKALSDQSGVAYLDQALVKGRKKPIKIYSVEM